MDGQVQMLCLHQTAVYISIHENMRPPARAARVAPGYYGSRRVVVPPTAVGGDDGPPVRPSGPSEPRRRRSGGSAGGALRPSCERAANDGARPTTTVRRLRSATAGPAFDQHLTRI